MRLPHIHWYRTYRAWRIDSECRGEFARCRCGSVRERVYLTLWNGHEIISREWKDAEVVARDRAMNLRNAVIACGGRDPLTPA